MPGRKWGENPRVVEARERKETKKNEEKSRKEKAVEDAKWVENDSKVFVFPLFFISYIPYSLRNFLNFHVESFSIPRC